MRWYINIRRIIHGFYQRAHDTVASSYKLLFQLFKINDKKDKRHMLDILKIVVIFCLYFSYREKIQEKVIDSRKYRYKLRTISYLSLLATNVPNSRSVLYISREIYRQECDILGKDRENVFLMLSPSSSIETFFWCHS